MYYVDQPLRRTMLDARYFKADPLCNLHSFETLVAENKLRKSQKKPPFAQAFRVTRQNVAG